MWLWRQLIAALYAPLAARRLGRRCLGWALLYLLLAAVLLTLVGALLAAHQQDLRGALLAYLLPESWQFAGDLLLQYVIEHQAWVVLVNAIVSGTLLFCSLFLFPVKEKLSACFEEHTQLTERRWRELSLSGQALEELKLLLLYLTSFMIIFWIGYHPHRACKLVASILSFGFLFFSIANDFIAPLLQRHGLCYSQVVKTLLKTPLAALAFGALFAAPGLFIGHYLKRAADISMSTSLLLLFGVSVVSIVWATVAGTWLGARLLESAQATPPMHPLRKLLAMLLLLGLAGTSGYVYARLGLALHHKSQLLKCHFSVDPSSMGLDLPPFKLKSLLSQLADKQLPVGVHFTIQIENPTPYRVALEKNRLEIKHEDTLIAQTSLSPVAVDPGQKVRERLKLRLTANPWLVLKGKQLLTNKWRLTLYLEIAPQLEFPIYLLYN